MAFRWSAWSYGDERSRRGGGVRERTAAWRGVRPCERRHYAAFLVMFRALNRGAGLAAGLLADASLGAALVAAAAGVLADPGFTLIPEATAAFWLIMAALGPQVVGWLAILYALPRLAALDTSVVLLLQPVLTVLWAWWLLAETPSAIQLGGVALVLVGVTIVSSFGSTKRRTERKAADSGGAP
jgi:Permeases of the drug/metabolite transporter (DMT) superfamily